MATSQAGVLLAAAAGELTQLNIKYKHGVLRSKQPHEDPLRSSQEEGDERPAHGATAAATTPFGRSTGDMSSAPSERNRETDRMPARPPSVTAGTANILDKVPRGYTPRSASGRNSHHSCRPLAQRDSTTAAAAAAAAGARPGTTGTAAAGRREPFSAAGASSSTFPSARRRSRSASQAIGVGVPREHRHLPATEDENDVVGWWDNASTEDHTSATAASGLFHPATATVTSATAVYSLGSSTASPTVASGSSTGGGGIANVSRPLSLWAFQCFCAMLIRLRYKRCERLMATMFQEKYNSAAKKKSFSSRTFLLSKSPVHRWATAATATVAR